MVHLGIADEKIVTDKIKREAIRPWRLNVGVELNQRSGFGNLLRAFIMT
jgi:hypothetical protein